MFLRVHCIDGITISLALLQDQLRGQRYASMQGQISFRVSGGTFAFVPLLFPPFLAQGFRLVAHTASRKSDASAVLIFGRCFDQMLDRLEDSFNLLTLFVLSPFELVQPARKLLICGE